MFFFNRILRKSIALPAEPSKEPAKLCAAVASDVGCLRDNNEDNFLLGRQINTDCSNHYETFQDDIKNAWYFIGIFDGMGGGDIGEIAAKTAAETFLCAVEQLTNESSQAQVDTQLRKAFLDTNNKIIDLQQQHHIFGTTATILGTNGSVCKIYHLGDSRGYLVRENELFQLTRDQTLAQMKIDVGLYQQDDPQAEAEKHQLTEYIGIDHTKKHLRPLESEWFNPSPGDGILLCSDGLYDMCCDRQIRQILNDHQKAPEKVKALLDAALSLGGIDNITCIYMAFP